MKFDLIIVLLVLAMFRYPSFPYIVIYMLLAGADLYALIYSIRVCGVKKLNSPILLFSLTMLISNTLNLIQGGISLGYFVYGLLYALYLYTLERVIDAYRLRNRMDHLISQLSILLFMLNILSVISIAAAGPDRELANYRYFLGDKFVTSYALILGMVLFYYDRCIKVHGGKKPNTKKPLLMWIGTIFLCKTIHCNTGLIAALLTGILIFVPIKIKWILQRKVIVALSVLIFGVIVIAYSDILTNPFVQTIIVHVFHRNPGLTGRMNIYNHLPQIIVKKPLLGYGCLNDAVSRVVGLGNTQNGFLEMIVSYGIIGGGTFWVSVCSCVGNRKGITRSWCFFSMLFALIVASAIEVTYTGTVFYLLLFLCRHLDKQESR